MRDLSIYIHIPFCVRKCLYCDFLSFPLSGKDEDMGEVSSKGALWKNISCKEIENYVTF